MALIKLNNRGVKNATSFGSISSLGSLSLIQKQTASSSATISFTSGIDSTYNEYIFYFVNIHPQTDKAHFLFQADTGTNTNYNQTITSSSFVAYHNEAGSIAGVIYDGNYDQAQGTSFQHVGKEVNGDNDGSCSGILNIFQPSSSTFVKHFYLRTQGSVAPSSGTDFSQDLFIAGYFNTTTPLTRFQFKMSSGNIDSGDILLFGLN